LLLTTLIDELADEGVVISGRTPENPHVTGITDDSRKVRPGFIFVAVKGEKQDGTVFIAEALDKGAVAVISSEEIDLVDKACFIRHEKPRLLLTKIAAKFYPRQPEFIAAVTGTNGKTSVVNFCRQIWALMGEKSASIGTIGILDGLGKSYDISGSMTTPDPVTLHEKINELAENNIEYLAIEASSHGLDQYRLDGLKITTAAFTNLTRDHLDYHGTMENYLAAKKRLFAEVLENGGTAVINADSQNFADMKKAAEENGGKVISFGIAGKNIKLHEIIARENSQEIRVNIEGKEFSAMLNLVGEFQVSNILCAVGIVISSGFAPEKIVKILPKIKNVPGRMELAGIGESGGSVFVDYAHTPDALEKALSTLRAHACGKLIVIFGCGGNRDKGKRPEMGKVAGDLADMVIVTDDNPRSEDASTIRKEIMAGTKGAIEISDRTAAIEYGIAGLKKNDILLIAGKGHEKTQIIGDKIYPFDDVKIAAAILEKEKTA